MSHDVRAHVTNKSSDVPYQTAIAVRQHNLIADEPPDEGGQDLGIKPTEMLLGSLGACVALTVRMYADRKGWKLSQLDVKLELIATPGQKAVIKKTVQIDGALSAEDHARLMQIADRCPVHRMITEGVTVETTTIPQ